MEDGDDDPEDELGCLAHALRAHLERRLALGERLIPRTLTHPREPREEVEPDGAVLTPRPGPAPATRAPAAAPGASALFEDSAPASPAAVENRSRARACAGLDELRGLVAACTACALHRTRKQTVFADGSPRSRVLFVGEAPGQQEDEEGLPFVGAAGKLLTDIVQKGMRLPRGEVYIANILKCRPPGNREPAPEETELCTPFLDRQIELVNPEVVVALGLHAAHHLLRTGSPLSRLRGRVHHAGGRKVVVTYHPAYLLRNAHMKKACWEDIQLVMRELGLSTAR